MVARCRGTGSLQWSGWFIGIGRRRREDSLAILTPCPATNVFVWDSQSLLAFGAI